MKPLFSDDGRRELDALCAQPALFAFDFDGTLAPIVPRPDDARLDAATAQALRHLAQRVPLALVSGRARADLQARADIGARYLVGNHGNEGVPGEPEAVHAHAVCRRWLHALRRDVLARLHDPGILVEDKGKTLSIHYRAARDPAAVVDVLRAIAASLQPTPRIVGGKLVLNLLPAGTLDKFDALQRLAHHAGLPRLLYVGDDDTDEIVFRRAPKQWLTVRVDPTQDSAASYCLPRQEHTLALIEHLNRCLNAA